LPAITAPAKPGRLLIHLYVIRLPRHFPSAQSSHPTLTNPLLLYPCMIQNLTAAFISRFGLAQASHELKWMKHVTQAQPHLQLADMLRRRILGEPLQYILGTFHFLWSLPQIHVYLPFPPGDQPFGSLNLITRAPVLIPRPETEHWVMKLGERLSSISTRPKRLLDLGTGSGCIPLLLCRLCPPGTLHTHGIDISPHAIQLATDNAALCKIPAPLHEISQEKNTFKTTLANFLSPAFSDDANLQPPYDIITSNPPYITWDEYLELPRSVSDYEDPKALFGGPSGLDFYHAIARLVRRKGFLYPGAVVALEVGHTQAKEVEDIMRTTGLLRDTEIWCDPWGKQRTVLAHL
jgi:HemK-like putative methylase